MKLEYHRYKLKEQESYAYCSMFKSMDIQYHVWKCVRFCTSSWSHLVHGIEYMEILINVFLNVAKNQKKGEYPEYP